MLIQIRTNSLWWPHSLQCMLQFLARAGKAGIPQKSKTRFDKSPQGAFPVITAGSAAPVELY